MENTGRIRTTLDWRAREIVFGDAVDRAIAEELPYHLQVDRAHVVMLIERNILAVDVGRQLLEAMDDLVRRRFAPLRGRTASRGLYLLYEHWLIETLGERVGGAAHLGRSRNDLNATVLLLRLRPVYARLAREVLRLLAVLITRGERYAAVMMPVYTHFQAALPITYGHYLAGVALAMHRDLQGIEAAARGLDRCPLGAGAAGGTTLPIDTHRTARLLGFEEDVLHSVDAVASRDVVLRLLASATVLGITASRLAADLQLWSTPEFGLIEFPDDLVGSSSMLPQKRNAFLLEHIQGRAGAPLAAFTAAAMAMHATPFSNSVAVGTEGVKPAWAALATVTEAIVLTRLSVAGARPRPEHMRRRATEGFTFATELANRLVRETGLSFRQAHRRIGELVTAAAERREPFEVLAAALFTEYGASAARAWPDPRAVATAAEYGGGPAPVSLDRALTEARRCWTRSARQLADRTHRWRDAARSLDLATAARTEIRAAACVSACARPCANAYANACTAGRGRRNTELTSCKS